MTAERLAGAILAQLKAQGFSASLEPVPGYRGSWPHFRARLPGRAMPGAFAPDGGRIVTLRAHPAGRLERLGAWGDVEASACLYAAKSAQEAIAAALTP